MDVLQITFAFHSIIFLLKDRKHDLGANQTICEGVRFSAAHMGWQATVSFMQVVINQLR